MTTPAETPEPTARQVEEIVRLLHERRGATALDPGRQDADGERHAAAPPDAYRPPGRDLATGRPHLRPLRRRRQRRRAAGAGGVEGPWGASLSSVAATRWRARCS